MTNYGPLHKELEEKLCKYLEIKDLCLINSCSNGLLMCLNEFDVGDEIITTPANLLTISDYGAATEYRTNSPSGEYGVLYTSSSPTDGTGVGLLYYQAGIAVLTASIFNGKFGPRTDTTTSTGSISTYFQTGSISGSADGLRNRLYNVQFNNSTELNSTIYFCRVNHNEFNYSSNPTYLSSSKIVVKNESTDAPVSYITTVGLYSSDNELMAVAKVSEPLKKDPTNELTIRVRLDY